MSKFQDLTGQKFGKLTVINRAADHIYSNGRSRIVWHCICDCGNYKDVTSNHLKNGHIMSCGCYRAEKAREFKHVDLTGNVYGKLTVLNYLGESNWECLCECGIKVIRKTGALTSGNTNSCGNHRFDDLTNEKYGEFTVIQRVDDKIDSQGRRSTQWLCQCSCGNKLIRQTSYIKKLNNDANCGCKSRLAQKLVEQGYKVSGGKFINLIGETFGRLTVVKRLPNKIYGGTDNAINWQCVCECGNFTEATTNALRQGVKQSCGCIRKESLSKIASERHHFKDLIGLRFERLVVVKHLEHREWLCKCDCGNYVKVSSKRLLRHDTKSCGCLQKFKAREHSFINLTGQEIGFWKVLYESDRSCSGKIMWRCLCQKCGDEYDVDGGNLRSRQTTMCQKCSHKENGIKLRSDLKGEVFGKLKVIEFAGIEDNRTFWKCLCECGNEVIKPISALTSGNTRSCGCWHRSKYEDWCIEILSEWDYEYDAQVWFDDLKGINSGYLTYDFGIYVNGNLRCLIECQGQQHYKPIDLYGGEERFEIQKFHDDLKREYAKDYLDVPLIEIPYTFKEIEVKELFEPGGQIYELVFE